MSAHFVTPDSSVFYHAVSRTGKGILRCHVSLFQACCRRNDLKCGSRLIRINESPYEAWFVKVKDVSEKEELLSAKEYEALVESEKE